MTLTLISHFYNEEFLLPYWLKHHVPMFDHGVLIDYDSTDRSVEIIRSLAPKWEVRKSRNRIFHYLEVDREVMEIEREFSGWKMALNTTEFLVHDDIRTYVAVKEKQDVIGVRTTGLIMVDRLEDRGQILTNAPLVQQKRYGYIELEHTSLPARCRLLHRNTTGEYRPGRHTTAMNAAIDANLFLCWFGWSPMDQIKQRKLQIKTRIPPEHFEQLKGVQHNIDEAQLEMVYLDEEQRSKDLWVKLPKFNVYVNEKAAGLKPGGV